MKARVAILAIIVLGGCGKVGNLEPRSGDALPPQAYAQTEKQSAERLLGTTEQSRPGRSDELLRRSESRTGDPFDVPPGSEPTPLEGTEKAKAKTPAKPSITDNAIMPAPTDPEKQPE